MSYRIAYENLSVIEKEELGKYNIERLLLKAAFFTVYVTNNGKFVGWLNLDTYIASQGKEASNPVRYDYVPCIKETEDIKKRLEEMEKLNPYLACIPVVNSQYEIIYAITTNPKRWQDELYEVYMSLDKAERVFGSGGWKSYFVHNNIKKCVVLGINQCSFKVVAQCQDIVDISIVDNVYAKEGCTENIIDVDAEVQFFDDLYAYLEESNVDCVIVTDWRYRNYVNCKNLKMQTIWLSDFVKKELSKYEIEALRMQYSAKLERDGVILKTIGIPNEKELGISIKGRGNALDWYTWFAKQVDGTIDDGKDFMRMRMESSKSIKKTESARCLNDYESRYINIKAGCRCIPEQNFVAENTIYLIGPCIVSGQFNKDEYTLGNFLQKRINDAGQSFKVVCLALPNEVERTWYFKGLERFKLKKGDMVFWIETGQKFFKYDISLEDTYRQLLKEYGDSFYFDFLLHVGKEATNKISEVIFNEVINKTYSQLPKGDILATFEDKSGSQMNAQLREYIETIKKEGFLGKLKIGSIVMNCNPFTKGHRYLIEYASKCVDYLYIFVVEEDKSFFKFKDRIEMVKKGTIDLENVMVFPSGQFMISANTFSEYFTKDTIIKDIDASMDVELFGRYIAPSLGITTRFLGKEPIDLITKQYNEALKNILPQYGVNVIEIDRLATNEDVISASRVRKYLANKEWDSIKEIVPQTTYDYLKEMYNE